MIICAAHDFGFVHIAKCAGSTIRQQLRDRDDLQGRFSRTIRHPELGLINGQHVPLATLRDHFPEDFAALRRVTSYAVTRAPFDRFVSGISQLIRDRIGEPGEMSQDQILATARGVIDYLQATPGLPDRTHILFARQCDYTDLDGERVITHVYAMEHMDALMNRLEAQHGLSLMRDQTWNPTVTYRFRALTGPLKTLKDKSRRVLPLKAYVAARDVGIRLFTRKGAPKLSEALSSASDIQAFVEDYYAADRTLYRAARGTAAVTPGRQ